MTKKAKEGRTPVNLCNINGEILDESEARIPVLDRGFLFGDSIYEVVRTLKGRFFFMDRHLRRLRRSGAKIAFEVPFSDQEIEERCRETCDAAGNEESYVRLILTRGTGSAPNIDLAYAPEMPNFLIMVRPLPKPLKRFPDEGLSVRLVQLLRNDPRSLDPNCKSGNYLNNIMGLAEAKAKGADTALFLNADGCLTEAPTSNVWVVHDGQIATPPLRSGLLSGITRELLLELGQREGLAMEERELSEAELRDADEIFLSSTLMGVGPVVRLDDGPVGSGVPGPVTLDLAARFQRFADEAVS